MSGVTLVFLGFVGLCAVRSAIDWRQGWILALVVGVLQDPVRKMTPGQPVWLMFMILVVFGAMAWSNSAALRRAGSEFERRFPRISGATVLFLLFLLLAAVNGLMNFGIAGWKAPALSFFLYAAPIPAVLIAYVYVDREERLLTFLHVYAAVTSVALIGTILEYLRVPFPGLGLVGSLGGDYIRHLPGVQIRMVSGFYRGPDIMGLHAATLVSIAIAMSVRPGKSVLRWPWLAVTGWGFLATMISGRRKALYFIAAFAVIFLWRYAKRLRAAEIVAIVAAASLVAGVVSYLSRQDNTRVYTRGAATTRSEVAARFEGGAVATLRQVGIMGGGLGIATQGARHFVSGSDQMGWQEGGLAKLTAELGLPGIAASVWLLFATASLMLRLTAIGDVPGSSQFLRVTLFSLIAANGASFVASAQAYSDPLLLLLPAFYIGALFATATLDEKASAVQQPLVNPLPRTITA